VTDLLDKLRASNPVDADALGIPPRLSARVLDAPSRSRRPWRLPTAAALAAACVGLIFAAVGRDHTPDLAARAYAATTGPGVIHWRTDIANYQDGRLTLRQRSEGWSSDGVAHVLDYDLPGGKARLTSDRRIADGRLRAWVAVSNDYVIGPAPSDRNLSLLPDGDPLVAFRRAYREGSLTRIGGGRYRLTPQAGRRIGLTLTYELDRRTAVPKRLVVRSDSPAATGRGAHRNTSLFTFSVYEKLPSTPSTRARLALLPHPGAGPSKVPAANYFEALRTGRAPTGARGRELASMAGQMTRFHIDAAGIRQVREGVWLMPGRGYVCVTIAGRRALVGGCSTVDQAAARGISVGTSRGGITLVVPDGVRVVQARLPHHPWRTFPIEQGTVQLPSLGYHWRFERK
jgi:hypothetical protein